MKKIIFLAVAAIVFSINAAFSQEITYGVKGGVNLANLTNSGGEADMKASFYLGGVAEFRTSDRLAIAPELVYSRQGFQATEDGIKIRMRTNYLNLPVLVKLYVSDGLSIDFGPQVGYMLNSDVWAKSGGQTTTIDLPNEMFPFELNQIDASFVVGLTYNIDKCFIQGRANLGFTDVAKDDPDHSKNIVFQLGAGYRF